MRTANRKKICGLKKKIERKYNAEIAHSAGAVEYTDITSAEG